MAKVTVSRYMLDDYERRLLEMWRINSETYRTLPDTYQELMIQKRILGVKPLNRILKSELKEYPNIPFLGFESEEGAKEYLADKTKEQLKDLISEIDMLTKYNYIYQTLLNWVWEARYKIEHIDARKSKYMVDANTSRHLTL